MLTATDIHYIVGLLTAMFGYEGSVDFELGSMLPDIAAKKNRDVDITLTYHNPDGTIAALKGWEVKKHKRPLTTEQVEQLCLKFNDIPSITQRGIISASGYTKAAIQKAHYHHVDLYYLEPWDNPYSTQFFRTAFMKDFTAVERIFNWHKTFPEHTLLFKAPVSFEVQRKIALDAQLYTVDGLPYRLKTLGDLYSAIDQQTLTAYIQDHKSSQSLAPNHPSYGQGRVDIVDDVYIDLSPDKPIIRQVLVTGHIICLQAELKPDFKILRKHGDVEPFIGCAILESQLGLAGIHFNKKTGVRTSGMFFIPPSTRLKQKINQETFVNVDGRATDENTY